MSKGTVLIVEDDPIARRFVAEVVSQANFQTVEAENADEAIHVLD